MRLFVCIAEPRKLLLMAAVLVGPSSLAFSSTVAVGTCTTLPFYLSIQTAVNSVPAGSTIKVCPGTYAEQVLITKNLTLTGVAENGLTGTSAVGQNNPVITSPAGGVTLNIPDLAGGDPIYYQIAVESVNPAQQVKVNISNIIVDGSNNQIAGCGMDLVGIAYQNASGTIDHVVTRYQELAPDLFGCQDGLAIFVESGYGSGGSAVVTIENSGVHDYDKNGITVDGSATIASITGNYVVGIGATSLIAQNGIQVSDGATGSMKNNTVTDDVYINQPNCGTGCTGSSGILIYDSGSTTANPLTVSGNTISNTQLAIVAYADSAGTADYNTVTSNKITGTLAAGTFLDDGIDLCGNHNSATSNTVFNSSGSGVHIDSSCTESGGVTSGNDTTVSTNTINEACAGVLTGGGMGNSETGNITYNVIQTTYTGDTCPANPSQKTGAKMAAKLRPAPLRH